MTEIKKGDDVRWKWGKGTAEGTVTEKITAKTTRTVKGKKITRDASPEDPAFVVKQEDGDRALKSGSELKKA